MLPRIVPIRPRGRKRRSAAHTVKNAGPAFGGHSLTVARQSAVCAQVGGSGQSAAVPIPTP